MKIGILRYLQVWCRRMCCISYQVLVVIFRCPAKSGFPSVLQKGPKPYLSGGVEKLEESRIPIREKLL